MLPERIKTEMNNLIERGCACARVPAAACGRRPWAGPSGLAAMSQGRAGLPGNRSCPGGRRPGRAEITGSREGAKPRRFDENRTNFCQGPRAASVEPLAGKGHPGPQPPSARRARMHAGARARGRETCRAEGWGAGLRQGRFSGARDKSQSEGREHAMSLHLDTIELDWLNFK